MEILISVPGTRFGVTPAVTFHFIITYFIPKGVEVGGVVVEKKRDRGKNFQPKTSYYFFF